jgi:hypothetical protein
VRQRPGVVTEGQHRRIVVVSELHGAEVVTEIGAVLAGGVAALFATVVAAIPIVGHGLPFASPRD